MIYICSDWHFSHNKDFCYLPRGVSNINEMNQKIIKNHNEIVSSEDVVYCLGDCCFGTNNFINQELIESLKGNIYIITGNHCTDNKIKMYKQCNNVIDVFSFAHLIKYKGYHFYLSHYPTLTSNYDMDKPLKQKVINICGHSHTTNKWHDWDKGPIYHVEMDAHNCYPVLLDNIIEEMNNKVDECLKEI